MSFSRKMILTLAAMSLAICGFAAEAVNLIRNGSFEKELSAKGQCDNWALPKGFKLLPGGKDGKQYMEANGVISTWGLAIRPNKTYKLSFWVKKTNKWLGVTIYGVDSQKKQVRAPGMSTYIKEAYPEWEKKEMTVSIPADFRHGRIIFATHNGVVSLDGVSITEVPAEQKK